MDLGKIIRTQNNMYDVHASHSVGTPHTHWILPAIGQENNLASKYFLECVEDSFLVLANEKEGSELMKTNPKFQELAQLILEKEIMNQQQHFTEFQIVLQKRGI
jgi:hypothetical protein